MGGQEGSGRDAKYYNKSLGKTVLRFLFSHVGLLFLVAAYAVAGAYLFIHFELPEEEVRYLKKQQRGQYVEDSIQYLANLFWHYQDKNYTHDEWSRKVKGDLGELRDFVVEAVNDVNYDGDIMGWQYDWTIASSLLFTISIMSTVGYGHISPKTPEGQITVILYALVGIPLLLIFLAGLGDSMASSLKYSYSRGCCRWFRSKRKKSECGGIIPKGQRLIDEEVGNESYMPTNEINVPIILILVIITIYLLIGAGLFSNWEGWDMLTACYFAFVTFSTIGFGDYVPGNSFLEYSDGIGATMKMLVTVLYCVLGMALVSMAINLMQEQIMQKVRWFAAEIGISSPDVNLTPIEVQRRRAKLREMRLGQMQTPNVQTGKNRVPTARSAARRRAATAMDPNRPCTAARIKSAAAAASGGDKAEAMRKKMEAQQTPMRPVTPTQISVASTPDPPAPTHAAAPPSAASTCSSAAPMEF